MEETVSVRKMISKQMKHSGGFAHVEQDTKNQDLFVVCSGCGTDTHHGRNLAAALTELKDQHPGPVIAG